MLLDLDHLNIFLLQLSRAFVIPDPEPPIISILYGWSGIYDHFELCSALFSFVITSSIKVFVCYNFLLYTSFGDEKEAERLFKEQQFYNPSIEKPYINNINMLS